MAQNMEIEVNVVREDSRSVVLSDAEIQEVVTETLRESNVLFAGDISVAVTVVFVGDPEIQRLNRDYREKDKPTDVLSFPDTFVEQNAPGVDRVDEGVAVTEDVELGDIILSCATIERYATMDDVEIARAYRYVLSHGVLHTLGYNHSDMMFAIQDRVTDRLYETTA